MAYIKINHRDNHGTISKSAYTHIESYSNNVVNKILRINLVTYISEEAKDLQLSPIEQEHQRIKGVDYDNMFGKKSSTVLQSGLITTRNSDNLRVIYETLNKMPKWQADNIEPIFEIIIKDVSSEYDEAGNILNVGERKVGDEISRTIAWDGGLVLGEDFAVTKMLVAADAIDVDIDVNPDYYEEPGTDEELEPEEE